MPSSAIELDEIFPPSHVQDAPLVVESELQRGERLVWFGSPFRWGLFNATPFVLILVGAFGYLTYLGAASEASAWQYLMMIASAQSGTDALILPGLAAGYLVILGLALRDPRGRWTYVVTDRRLMTFYKGKKLREADVSRLDRLQVVQGIDGRLRNVGDVVWARVNREHGKGGRGPDQGRHGFRGMPEPRQWKDRLLAWGKTVARLAADDARSFRERTADPAAGNISDAGLRRIANHNFGFSMALPEHWVGRIGFQERAPFTILGLKMPFDQILVKSNEALHKPPASWNFIKISGRSGMKVNINVNEGPPVASFETSRDKVGKTLIDAEGNWQCGPLAGYRIDYRYLDKLHCRFAMLAGDGFHVLVNVTIPPDQADDLLPAVDAVFGSIRTI